MNTIAETASYMKSNKLYLSTAESCTAGLIAATLADVPGAGALLDRAFVVYSPAAKTSMLGVSPETIELYGLTSIEVAGEMARGALARSESNVAIGNTGVADGNGVGTEAGVQCLAWSFLLSRTGDKIQTFTEVRKFAGDRQTIRQAAADYALQRLPFYARQLEINP